MNTKHFTTDQQVALSLAREFCDNMENDRPHSLHLILEANRLPDDAEQFVNGYIAGRQDRTEPKPNVTPKAKQSKSLTLAKEWALVLSVILFCLPSCLLLAWAIGKVL